MVLLYLVVLILVAVVLFGLGSVLFGRGEPLPPLPRATTATVLPASGVTGADVDAVKFTQTLRGYKTSEVDWVLDRLGQELDLLRGQLAAVRAAHGSTTTRRRRRAGRRWRARAAQRQGRLVTVEDDGRIRCGWIDQTRLAPADFVLYRDYHDTEWGQPLRDSAALFERISLEAFQSGLSWLIILRKRENFRRAFHGFDVERIARYTKRDIDRLMADTGIVRNRAKVEATIANARAVADLDVDLGELLWSFAPPSRPRPADLSQVPAVTPESTAMAKELKRRGFRFVGPTTAYALMQATGMVDDHTADCWVPAIKAAS